VVNFGPGPQPPGEPDLLFRNNGNGTGRVVAAHLLWVNQGDGTFLPNTNAPMARTYGGGRQAAWADYDRDGHLDLFVGGVNEKGFLYRNIGDGAFVRITNSIIVRDLTADNSNSTWADFDNDGSPDLLVTIAGSSVKNYLYRNDQHGNFTKVTTGPVATEGGKSICAAWADYDNDGFLDLAVSNRGDQNEFLYRNNGNENRWLKLKLVGTVSNRSAIGAKVRLRAFVKGELLWQRRDISSDNGSPLEAHFGLGDATMADTLRIEWPSGIVQELHNVSTKQFLTVTEPAKLEPHEFRANGLVELKVKSWKGHRL
jgi:hypothetical protein